MLVKGDNQEAKVGLLSQKDGGRSIFSAILHGVGI